MLRPPLSPDMTTCTTPCAHVQHPRRIAPPVSPPPVALPPIVPPLDVLWTCRHPTLHRPSHLDEARCLVDSTPLLACQSRTHKAHAGIQYVKWEGFEGG